MVGILLKCQVMMGVKVLWIVVDNHVVEEKNENYYIELLGLNCFDEDNQG